MTKDEVTKKQNEIKSNIDKNFTSSNNLKLNPNVNEPTQVIQPPLLDGSNIKTDKDKENKEFLASLISQGFAMFGAGIAGRDPSRVGEQISEMRNYYDKQKIAKEQYERSKRLMDPKSKESETKRNLYSQIMKFQIPKEVSASDLEDNNVLQGLRQQQLMKLQPSVKGGVVSQPKPEKEKKNPFQKEITEITIRSKNALDALDKIEKIVSQYGTKELSGPQEKQLEQLINNVSINYNKVLDPTSVVREGEAKQVAESLGIGGYGGYFTSTDTALQQIKSFKELVNNTKNNALAGYQNLPMPGTLPSMTEEDKLMIEEAKKNPNDPTNAEILRTWGIR